MIAAVAWLLFQASAIAPPRIGFFHDGGRLRPVVGVRGNFIVGEAWIEGVLASAFDGEQGAVKTAAEVVLFDAAGRAAGRLDAPPGNAVFAFSPGTVWVWLEASAELIRWRPDSVERRPLAGAVRAMHWAEGRLHVVTEESNALYLDGRRLACPAGPVLAAAEALLCVSGAELLWVRDDVVLARAATPEPLLALEQMGEGWIHARGADSGAHYAVRGAEVYQLPVGDAPCGNGC